ncbi:MAG TPA: hypothetical protein VMH88_07965 [Gemmatimonadales bacterium]|nr:hypothetical protein [Gemmatimonadales bacterium]
MNRKLLLSALALAFVDCNHSPQSPTGPAALRTLRERAGAPPPSPLVTVPLPRKTLELWPYQGFGFGVQSDPVNLIWTGRADPRRLRAALLQLNGDRTAFGFPNVFPFNCTWHDEPEVQPEVAYTTASGWVGSPILLECGAFDQARFHLRFFDVGGGVTVGGAPFEVFIPGTVDHQTISWALAEQFVVVDFLRSGLLDPAAPFFTTGPLNPTSFDTIPAVIYNGIPTALRQAIGGPLNDVTSAVPIPSSGEATVMNVRSSVAVTPADIRRSWVQQFDQVIPQPFCSTGPHAYLYVVGPVALDQHVVVDRDGDFVSRFHAAGRLNVTPIDPSTGQPIGATYQAVVREEHTGSIRNDDASAAFLTQRALLPPNLPGHGTFEFGFSVGPDGTTRAVANTRCGS